MLDTHIIVMYIVITINIVNNHQGWTGFGNGFLVYFTVLPFYAEFKMEMKSSKDSKKYCQALFYDCDTTAFLKINFRFASPHLIQIPDQPMNEIITIINIMYA